MIVSESANPFGWPLPFTDAWFQDWPYPPPPDPGESLAVRLLLLVHKAYNPHWNGDPDGYWVMFGQRVEHAATEETVERFWARAWTRMLGNPLPPELLHEKNLIVRPSVLPVTQVPDDVVLQRLQDDHVDLCDRLRVYVFVRRQARKMRGGVPAIGPGVPGSDDTVTAVPEPEVAA